MKNVLKDNVKKSQESHKKTVKDAFTSANTQLFDSYHEVSESNVELNSLKISVLNEHMKSIDTRGRQVVEAENYCDLLNFDQSLVKAGLAHLDPKGTIILKNIEDELFNKGLFNIAQIISLLRKKTEGTGLVHNSLTSIKNSQNARTPKSEIEEEFYKEFAQWVIQMYLDDKAGHNEKGLTPRNKKGSDTSADNLILEMAQREVILQRPPLGVESEKTDRQDGTLFGFPEIPESLKKIQLSKRFIQKTLKNIN